MANIINEIQNGEVMFIDAGELKPKKRYQNIKEYYFRSLYKFTK